MGREISAAWETQTGLRNEKAMEGNGVNQSGEIQARSWPFMLVCGAGLSQEIIAKRQHELLCRVEGKALGGIPDVARSEFMYLFPLVLYHKFNKVKADSLMP